MFGFSNRRGTRHDTRRTLSHLDTQFLRNMGLNPDDFRDALDGRRSSLLFEPFRDGESRK